MDVTNWLLDSDPAIRWQVMRDLTNASGMDVAAERSRVATEGWGAHVLALQHPDGGWGTGTYNNPLWKSTTYTLLLLRHLGVDPAAVRPAIEKVRDNVQFQWSETDFAPFFNGETEPCINGQVLALAAYFGVDGVGVEKLVDRLLNDQLSDGGWNCEAPENSSVSSFSSTIMVLEGLLGYERAGGADVDVPAARARGEEYLLARHLFRSLRTGEVVDETFMQFSFPPRYWYDVLWGLDYFRSTGLSPDLRCADAIQLVRDKQSADGTWPLENVHEGEVHVDIDGAEGEPSRWNTLRALRVLRWWENGAR